MPEIQETSLNTRRVAAILQTQSTPGRVIGALEKPTQESSLNENALQSFLYGSFDRENPDTIYAVPIEVLVTSEYLPFVRDEALNDAFLDALDALLKKETFRRQDIQYLNGAPVVYVEIDVDPIDEDE